jgi:hypothetical protein
MDKLILTYKGSDSWGRPVYEDDTGKLYCDVDPRPTSSADICTKCNNAFDGEPDTPIRNKEIVLKPHRITW